MPADDPPDGRRPLLEIADLGVEFASGGRTFRAVDHVSLSIAPGERFGMVGETGAGKSLTAWAAIGLLPRAARMTSGHVWYEGSDLTTASPEKLSSLRGREIAFIVQNPAAALSPMTRIGDQLVNAYRAHRKTDRATAQARAVEGLRQVGIPDPARRARSYPHELSIGMAQRVLIAMALLHEPKLLIADEPTSGLDVTIQAEILDLVMELVRERNTALWLITHDLGVVAHYCERAAVIFAGSIVETGPVATLFNNPAHPYTRGLVDSRLTDDRGRERFNIAGAPPDLSRKAVGCRFAYRCPWVEERCRQEEPALSPLEAGHEVRCWVAQERSRPPDDTDQGAMRRRLCPARAGEKEPRSRSSRFGASSSISSSPAGRCSAPWTASTSTSAAAKRSGWWAKAAAANRLWPAACSGSPTSRRGKSASTGRTSPGCRMQRYARLRPLMQMVFQDPLGSLDPRQTLESIIEEPLRLLTSLTADQRRARIRELLEAVRLSAMHLGRYPHQLSGGQQQRVGIARALATNPRLCVLDEPTSAVDWPIRAELLELLDQLRRRDEFLLPVHLARPQRGEIHLRPRGGDVSRPHRRGGADRDAVHRPGASLHAGAPVLDAGAVARRFVGQGGAAWRAGQPDQSPLRLQAPSALPDRDPCLCGDRRRPCCRWVPDTASPACGSPARKDVVWPRSWSDRLASVQ